MAKPRHDAEAVLKTYDMFIYGDVLYIGNLSRENNVFYYILYFI